MRDYTVLQEAQSLRKGADQTRQAIDHALDATHIDHPQQDMLAEPQGGLDNGKLVELIHIVFVEQYPVRAAKAAGQARGQLRTFAVHEKSQDNTCSTDDNRGNHQAKFCAMGEMHLGMAQHWLQKMGPTVGTTQGRRDAKPPGSHCTHGEDHKWHGDHQG